MSLIIHRHSFHHIRNLLLSEFLEKGHRNTPENAALIDDIIVAEIFDESMARMCWTNIPATTTDVRQRALDTIGLNHRKFEILMSQGIVSQIHDKVASSIPKGTWDIWTLEYEHGNAKLSNYGDYRVAMWEETNPNWKIESVHPEEIVIPMILRKPMVISDAPSSEEEWRYPTERSDSILGPDDMPALVQTCLHAVIGASEARKRAEQRLLDEAESQRQSEEEEERDTLYARQSHATSIGHGPVQTHGFAKRGGRSTR